MQEYVLVIILIISTLSNIRASRGVLDCIPNTVLFMNIYIYSICTAVFNLHYLNTHPKPEYIQTSPIFSEEKGSHRMIQVTAQALNQTSTYTRVFFVGHHLSK